jgi:hypothetical protein
MIPLEIPARAELNESFKMDFLAVGSLIAVYKVSKEPNAICLKCPLRLAFSKF